MSLEQGRCYLEIAGALILNFDKVFLLLGEKKTLSTMESVLFGKGNVYENSQRLNFEL